MGVRILFDNRDDYAVLYCSTSMFAFGPVFTSGEDNAHDGDERAEAFLRWLNDGCTAEQWSKYEPHAFTRSGRRDPRELTDWGLERAYSDWLAQEANQWMREEAPDCEHCGDKMTWTATAPVPDAPMEYRCFSHECMVTAAKGLAVSGGPDA